MSNLPFVEEILADLRRFAECVEDGQDVDLGRDRFDLLTQLGLLERIQRSPARWMMTQAGEDAIAQPAAGEPVSWSSPKTIRHLIAQLQTLEPDTEIVSLLRMTRDLGPGREVREVPLSISWERMNGPWLAPFKSEHRKVLAFWLNGEQKFVPAAAHGDEAVLWDGIGVPPVGTVCEVLWNESRMEYLRTKVFGVNEHGQPIHRFDEGPKKFEYQADVLVTCTGTQVFRPIDTAMRAQGDDRLLFTDAIMPGGMTET